MILITSLLSHLVLHVKYASVYAFPIRLNFNQFASKAERVMVRSVLLAPRET